MPPNPLASTFAPTALGAALLGLSAALLAVDVGGTVVLDTQSGTPERTSANPPAAPAQPQVAAQPPQVAVQPPQVADPPSAGRSSTVAAERRPAVLAPERRLIVPPVTEPRAPAERQQVIAAAHAVRPVLLAVRVVRPAPVAARAVRPAPVALAHAPQAPRVVAVPAQPKPAVASIASLSDVRHFAMRRLSTNYPNISVISADTYSIGGNNVRVSMVVQNGSQRWIEKDVVKRSGTSLALETSARHGMPFTGATPQPSTGAEPDPGP